MGEINVEYGTEPPREALLGTEEEREREREREGERDREREISALHLVNDLLSNLTVKF